MRYSEREVSDSEEEISDTEGEMSSLKTKERIEILNNFNINDHVMLVSFQVNVVDLKERMKKHN